MATDSPKRNSTLREANVKYAFFWKADSPFSQWHLSKFHVDGQKYDCAEQYMMHQKAVCFEDHEIAKEILNHTSPRKIKSLGRKVKNFNEEVWCKRRYNIVKKGNMHKFSQREELKEELFDTAGKTLVEASPMDTIWGIGYAEDNPNAWNESTWNGQNLLGYALTEVRDELMKQEGLL